MKQRELGQTGRDVSVIGLGTWQIGGDWGEVGETEAFNILDAAAEAGVTFFDTADVYGDGRSEQLIGQWRAKNPEWNGTVATKMIRRAPAPSLEYATYENFKAWTDRSRQNLGVDQLDLVQLHCPETPVYSSETVYQALDQLVSEGAIAAYGVSVETVDEALTALQRPGVASIQIIYNAFRQKPLESVLPLAVDRGVGVIARVPLASGLLSGRYTPETTFAENDHRSFNRAGEAFDVGETFAGVDFSTGVQAGARFAGIARSYGMESTTAALAWIMTQEGVSSVIPGARNAEQAKSNAAAAEVGALPEGFLHDVEELYTEAIKPAVHHRW